MVTEYFGTVSLLQDPMNLGAILRSAAFLGVSKLIGKKNYEQIIFTHSNSQQSPPPPSSHSFVPIGKGTVTIAVNNNQYRFYLRDTIALVPVL
jgi:hypothetical protein